MPISVSMETLTEPRSTISGAESRGRLRSTGRQHFATAIAVIAACAGFLILRVLARQLELERSCIPFRTCLSMSTTRAFVEQFQQWTNWVPAFLGLTFAGVVLAERGWRWLFVLPAASLVLVPWMLGTQPDGLAEMNFPNNLMAGAGAAAALATVGGAMIADRKARNLERLRQRDAAAFAVCAAAFAVVLWVRVVHGDHPLAGQDTAVLVALFLFGAGVGMRRPWFPWAHLLVAITLSQGNLGQWWWNTPSSWKAVLPFIGIVFLGTLREPTARWLLRLDRRPLEGFVVFQALNVTDAVLTGLGLARGSVLEANPVARFIGMPAKIIIGGAAGWLLYRYKPRALILPVVALLGVLAYHLGGLVVNG